MLPITNSYTMSPALEEIRRTSIFRRNEKINYPSLSSPGIHSEKKILEINYYIFYMTDENFQHITLKTCVLFIARK